VRTSFEGGFGRCEVRRRSFAGGFRRCAEWLSDKNGANIIVLFVYIPALCIFFKLL